MRKRVALLLSALMLGFCFAGCATVEQNNIYNDDVKIANDDSYSTFSYASSLHNNDTRMQLDVGSMGGSVTLWQYDGEANEFELDCSMEVSSGKAKLVVVAPDGTVNTLLEPSGTGEETVRNTLATGDGEYRIKLVAADKASLSASIACSGGQWGPPS